MCVFSVSPKVHFAPQTSRFVKNQRCACSWSWLQFSHSGGMSQEQEITHKVLQYSAPDVDTWRGWELRRLFGHVHGTADVAKVLKNEKRMIADLVERVEGGHLAEQDVLPSRTSWNKKNPTQEVPRARRAPHSHPRFSFVSLWHVGSETPGPARPEVCSRQPWRYAYGRPARSLRIACAAG